jgi:2-polyprenyl-3-methyl-5-hydroxy-6-metoxy-1,4-benzoquinol methylase
MIDLLQLNVRFNNVFSTLNQVEDQAILAKIAKLLDEINVDTFERNYLDKLNNPEWPAAVDLKMICDLESEEEKNIRAASIFSIFLASKIHKGDRPASEKRVLDFGCGEGHVVKQISSVAKAIGYDITAQNWDKWHDRQALTTSFGEVVLRGPYDLILIYDVLDHAEGITPVDILKQAKSVLSPGGQIIVRCHPWCGRHGNHLWKLNKAFAHVVFSEEELAKIGHKGMHTIKVTHPEETYSRWFSEAGLRITWENLTWEQSGPIFENNPDLKMRVLSHYPGAINISYNLIEQIFRDYVLEV